MLKFMFDRLGRAVAAAALTAISSGQLLAAPSTSRGQISVVQVTEMLDRAPKDPTARQVLTAYLAGLGETAGVLVDAAAARAGSAAAACRNRLSLDENSVRHALATAVAGREDLAETAATPLIVHNMMSRAGCRLDDR